MGEMLANLDKVAAHLMRACPSLEVGELSVLGDGFWSVALEAGGVVFRIPKSAEGAKKLAIEKQLLDLIRDRLPRRVPSIEWVVAADSQLKFGAFAHRKLEGQPLAPGPPTARATTAAASLGRSIAALHAIEPSEVSSAGLPELRPNEIWSALRGDVQPVLDAALARHELLVVERWFDELLSDPSVERFVPTLVHGDLWYEHVLVDPQGQVAGVLDFGDAAIGDPAQDLAVQRYMGTHFASGVVEAYEKDVPWVDDEFHHRARRYWEVRELYGIQWASKYEDQVELTESIAKFRRDIAALG